MTPATRRWLATAAILAGAAGVFGLPYAFPPATPAYSESYALGFSNRAAVLAVWITLGLLGLLAAKPARLFFDSIEDNVPAGRLPAWVWCAAAALYAGIDLAVYARIPLEQYGESAYTLPRVAYVANLGLQPYRDFEFAYGPALIYLPALAQKLFDGLLPAALIYTLVHILMNAAGLALLAWTLNALPQRKPLRLGAFTLLALAWANPTMGMQYVTLRWVLPFALLTWTYRRIPAEPGVKLNARALSLRAGLALAAMLLVSPEYSVVLAVALVILFAALAWARGRVYLSPLLAMTAAVGLFVLAVGPAYLQSILGFAGGGMLFPVYPTAAILVYLAALALAVPHALAVAREKGPEAAGTLACGWMLLCVGLVPGALGRCDTGHICMYGWAGMLAAVTLLFECGGAPARLGTAAWVLAFVVGGQASLYLTYADELRPFWNAQARTEPRLYPPAFSAQLDRYPALRTPYVVDPAVERYLQESGRFVPEYYRGLVDVFTEADLNRKIAEAERGGALLVPAALLALPARMGAQGERMDWEHYERVREAFYRQLLLYPLTYKRAKAPFMPDLLLGLRVLERFDVAEQVDEYLILTPKNQSSSSPASSSSSPSTPVEPPR